MHTARTLPAAARCPHRGFTLLEVLLASVIFAVVMIAVYTMYEGNQALFTRGERVTDTQQNARAALDVLSREIRMAGYLDDPGNLNPRKDLNPILIATNSTLVIRGNVLGLASPNGSMDIFYGVSAGASAACPTPPCLLRGTFNPAANPTYSLGHASATSWDVIAYNIQGVAFTYFNATNNPLVPAPALDGVNVGVTPAGLSLSPPNPPAAYAVRGAVRRIVVTLNAGDTRGIPYGGTPPAYVLWANINIRNQEDR